VVVLSIIHHRFSQIDIDIYKLTYILIYLLHPSTMIRGLAVTAALGVALAAPLDYEQAKSTIDKHISSFQTAGADMCTQYSCCNVTSSEACSLADMPKDETTLVLPGGDTRCIYSYSTPFAFQVIPGASDKVLMYFEGGGACW
jgi:hypothetical protein